jgi:hypothetical protein
MPVIHQVWLAAVKAVGRLESRITLQGWIPSFEEAADGQVTLGQPLVDDYLEVVRMRARRNTLLAAVSDLKVFFSVVAEDPLEVTTADVACRPTQ